METIRLKVGGMSCAHCQHAVETALKSQEGVRGARVDLQGGAAEVEFDPARVTPGQLAAAVREEGYEASVA